MYRNSYPRTPVLASQWNIISLSRSHQIMTNGFDVPDRLWWYERVAPSGLWLDILAFMYGYVFDMALSTDRAGKYLLYMVFYQMYHVFAYLGFPADVILYTFKPTALELYLWSNVSQ